MTKKVKIPVTFMMCGVVEIETEDGTIETALKNFKAKIDDIDLPKEKEYVDGSFEMSMPFEGAEDKDLVEFVKAFN